MELSFKAASKKSKTTLNEGANTLKTETRLTALQNMRQRRRGDVESDIQALTHNVFDLLGSVFDRFDLDKNDVLDEAELRAALNDLSLPCTSKDIETLAALRYGNRYLSRVNAPMAKADFIKFCVLQELHLLNIFHAIDANSDDFISFNEFNDGLAKLGWRLTTQETRSLFDQLDIEPDGKLTYTEWRKLITQAPPHGMEWVDVFHRFEVSSADINGDNLVQVHREQGKWATDLVAGFISGVVSRSITAPLERIKVELQLTASRQPPSVLNVVQMIYREGGLRAFFQGNFTNCLKVAPQSAIFFASTDGFKRVLPTRGDPAVAQQHSFFAGTLAGILSQLVIYPLEPLKTRMTVARPGQYASLAACTRDVFRTQGLVGFYRGVAPSLIGCIPYAGTQRLVYDQLQGWYTQYTSHERPMPVASFVSGFISSCIGMTVSYPFMVVRTRMHVQGVTHTLGDQQQHFRYQGLTESTLSILRNQGVAGFFRGLGANLVKAAPAAAVTFALYDNIKDIIRRTFPTESS